MKSTLILFFSFLLCFMLQVPAFAGSANQNPEKMASVLSPAPQSTSKVNSQAPQKWVDKLVSSKAGKWVGKMAQRVFSAKEFNVGGFCLGFFLGWIGLIIAYVMKDDDMIKWAWIGLASAVGLSLILTLILLIAGVSIFSGLTL